MAIQALTPGFCYCRDKPAVYAATAITIVSLIAISIISSGQISTPGCCLATCLTLSFNALIIATYLLTSPGPKATKNQKADEQPTSLKGTGRTTKPQEIPKVLGTETHKTLTLPKPINAHFEELNRLEALKAEEKTKKKKQACKKEECLRPPSSLVSPPPQRKSKKKPPSAPPIAPASPEILKKDPITLDHFATELMPKLHTAAYGLIERLVKAEGKKNASPGVVQERLEKLNASKQTILTLSPTIAKNYQKGRQPAQQSQLVRRMVIAFNVKDVKQLNLLFEEFDRAQKKQLNPAYSVDNDEKVKALYKEMLFKTRWILEEIEMLTSPNEPKHPADATYFYLMTEASKELSKLSKVELSEFEVNLRHLVNHHLTRSSGGDKCLEYMWIREPLENEKANFDKIVACLEASKGSSLASDHPAHKHAPLGYMAIDAALGAPWTWQAKKGTGGIGKAYSALNSGPAKYILSSTYFQSGVTRTIGTFSGYLIPSITKGMTHIGLVQEGEKHLDKPVEEVLLAVLTPLLNTYTDKNGVKGPIITAIQEAKGVIDTALSDLETKAVEEVVNSLAAALDEIQFKIS